MAEVSQRGTKRKRHEINEEDATLKIAGKLHHDLKGVRKAAKKAKAFEMQKLLKKLKGLRGKDRNSKEIPELEAQLDALKCTDCTAVANTALTTKLKKDHILSENTSVQAAISAQLSANLLVSTETGTPSSKVQSRLLSSKALATDIIAVVDGLKYTLQARTKGTVRVIDDHREDPGADEPSKRNRKTKIGAVKLAQVEDEDSTDSDEDERTGWSKDEQDGLKSRAADGVDTTADDGWESGSVLSGPGMANDEGTSSGSDSDNEEESEDEHENLALQPAHKGTNAKTRGSAESTFLPTLSVGFVRGDSESEWSDSETKTADVRKNRRGQRARRAIWEKKYGKNANHTKKQREAMETSGRAQRLGAVRKSWDQNPQHKRSSAHGGRSKSEGTPQYHQQADAGWVQRNKSGSNSSTNPVPALSALGPPQPQRREERGLHPSWEAKRKQKEKHTGGIVPAQGTKIKF